MAATDFHVYVGSEVGFLKGVEIFKTSFSNLNYVTAQNKDEEITAMCWEDAFEKKIYTGHRGQIVKIFDCETQSFPAAYRLQVGEGAIKGICCVNGHTVTAVESGIVKLWNDEEEKEDIEINTQGNLCRMVQNPTKTFHIATGGEENDLKIWDLQAPQTPIFKAKNVPNDFLDLRVPVWVTDMKFKPDDKIVTCTRHHQIRLYDPKAQRRPVINMEFEKYPLISLSLAHNEHQVVVGSGRGRMALIDLRKKLLVHVFKGFAGSIRCVQCHPTLPLVASCGLDRFLRIHDLNEHKLLKKIYLKTRLNCLLLKTNLMPPVENAKAEKVSKPKAIEIFDEEEEKIWNSMSVVTDGVKKKRAADVNTSMSSKRKKERNMLSNETMVC